MKNEALLKTTSIFYPLFEGGWVPIRNIMVPNRVECVGDGVQDVYMVDLPKLSAQTFEQVVRLVHQQCGVDIPIETAKAEMLERGLPLRAKHVQCVACDVPFFL